MVALGIFLYTLTPLHVGVGRAEGAHVDLPIQRDEFDLPVIWASSLKGALKTHAWKQVESKPPEAKKEFYAVFGRDPQEPIAETISGVTLLDARLLLIPARSSKDVWIYITSPHLLQLFKTYTTLKNTDQADKSALTQIDMILSNPPLDDKVYTSSTTGEIYINEQRFNAESHEAVKKIREIVKAIGGVEKEVAVVPDRWIVDLVRRSVIIQYRVRLDRATKTVQSGGLWSEEYLPQFTLLHSVAICRGVTIKTEKSQAPEGSSDSEKKYDENTICNKFREYVVGAGRNGTSVVWVGGKETIGKGLVKVVIP